MKIKHIINKNISMPVFKHYSNSEIETLMNNPFQSNSPIQLNRLTYSEYMQMPLINRVITRVFDIRTEKGMKQGKVHNQFMSSQRVESIIIDAIEELFLEYTHDDDNNISELGESLKTDIHKLFIYVIKLAWNCMPLRDGACYLEIDGVNFDCFGISLILLNIYDGFIITKPSYFQEALSHPDSVEPDFLCEHPLSEHFDLFECNFISFLLVFGLVNVNRTKDTGKLYVCKTELFDKLISIRPTGGRNTGVNTVGN